MRRFGSKAVTAVTALRKRCEDESEKVCKIAVLALAEIDPAEARTALPKLTEMAKDKDNYFQTRAATALQKIQGGSLTDDQQR